ncbi:MAG: hypothetical protein ABI970_15265, partial [Chloroflexota bacterium]
RPLFTCSTCKAGKNRNVSTVCYLLSPVYQAFPSFFVPLWLIAFVFLYRLQTHMSQNDLLSGLIL